MKSGMQLPELHGAKLIVNDTGTVQKNVPTLIHFWSLSCTACQTTMSYVRELAKNLEGQLQVISVHMPLNAGDEDIEAVKNKINLYNLQHPVYLDQNSTISNQFNNRFVPAFYLFDHLGKFRFSQQGTVQSRLVTKRIQRIIAENR